MQTLLFEVRLSYLARGEPERVLFATDVRAANAEIAYALAVSQLRQAVPAAYGFQLRGARVMRLLAADAEPVRRARRRS